MLQFSGRFVGQHLSTQLEGDPEEAQLNRPQIQRLDVRDCLQLRGNHPIVDQFRVGRKGVRLSEIDELNEVGGGYA